MVSPRPYHPVNLTLTGADMKKARKVSKAAPRRRARTPARKDLKPTLHCSFCGKTQHDVQALIAGPSVFICNECVAECNKYVALPVDVPRPKSPLQSIQDLDLLPDERLIRWLAIEAAAYEHSASGLQNIVNVLRGREVSWAVIGQALGISRQAAWDRFS